jgi:hypothetical protein
MSLQRCRGRPRPLVLVLVPLRPADDPFRTFSEWNSAADRKAYGDP